MDCPDGQYIINLKDTRAITGLPFSQTFSFDWEDSSFSQSGVGRFKCKGGCGSAMVQLTTSTNRLVPVDIEVTLDFNSNGFFAGQTFIPYNGDRVSILDRFGNVPVGMEFVVRNPTILPSIIVTLIDNSIPAVSDQLLTDITIVFDYFKQ
jgi:hypothetical protein